MYDELRAIFRLARSEHDPKFTIEAGDKRENEWQKDDRYLDEQRLEIQLRAAEELEQRAAEQRTEMVQELERRTVEQRMEMERRGAGRHSEGE